MMPALPRSLRTTLAGVVVVAGIVTILATGGGGGSTPTPATTGAISVNVGFGAVTNPPYQCTGAMTVTVSPVSLTGSAGTTSAQSRQVTFSRTSSTTPNEPACQETVLFPSMSPGSWNASNGVATCPVTVVAGQAAQVRIWNNACN